MSSFNDLPLGLVPAIGLTVILLSLNLTIVRLRDNKITVRPIAGTRPRGKSLKEDIYYEKDLLKDKKELSEHLMLLDLGRNDAGKVSKVNSRIYF